LEAAAPQIPMKQRIAYYFLLIYTLVLLKPIIATIQDGLSHLFAEAIHIATVHAKYGSNHLQREVGDLGSNSGRNHAVSPPEESFSPHINANEIIFFYCSLISPDFPMIRNPELLCVILSRQGPPPKLFC